MLHKSAVRSMIWSGADRLKKGPGEPSLTDIYSTTPALGIENILWPPEKYLHLFLTDPSWSTLNVLILFLGVSGH